MGQKLGITFRMLMLAGLVGLIAGLGAIVFYYLGSLVWHFSLAELAGYRPDHPAGEHPVFKPSSDPLLRPWVLFSLPAIGGVVSGWLVYRFAPEAAGHGTDAAIEAYHRKQGQIRARVPIVKLLASAITIGTGGSGGREGPIAQIGAGFGSALGRWLKLGPKERRILMVAGVGAGVGAIFRAPIAGAIFAAEVLYSDPDFEAEVIVPSGMASAVAFSIFAAGVHDGFKPLFSPPDLRFSNPLELAPYLVLALAMALFAALYTRFFYFVHDRFERWQVHPVLKPAVGGLLTGLVGLGMWSLFRGSESETDALSVLSFGYGILQNFFDQDSAVPMTASLLGAVAVGKVLTTSFTIGSGGSGGVFGPSIIIGGCAGGAIGLLFHDWFPDLVREPSAYMLVGMAGFFAAAAKTPFSTLLMVSEMTGSYHLLPPALWVCLIAYVLGSDQSLFRAQVSSHMRSPAHRGEYVRTVLANVTVDRFLKPGRPPLCIRLQAPLSSVIHDLDGSHAMVLPVVGEDDSYLGMVCLEEVHLASHSPATAPMLVAADLMREDVVPLYPGDTLYRAMELFTRNDLQALPIVKSEQGHEKVIGIVRRSDIQTEYLKHVHGAESRV